MENKEICSECGGRCCKAMPGNWYPQDWGLLLETPENQAYRIILKRLHSHDAQIDYWEPYDGEKLWLRPPTKDSFNKIWNGSRGGWCFYWSPSLGCSFSYEERPHECKTLVPSSDHKCTTTEDTTINPKLRAANAWLPFVELVKKAAAELGGREPSRWKYIDEETGEWA